jgi:hypothetical protein
MLILLTIKSVKLELLFFELQPWRGSPDRSVTHASYHRKNRWSRNMRPTTTRPCAAGALPERWVYSRGDATTVGDAPRGLDSNYLLLRFSHYYAHYLMLVVTDACHQWRSPIVSSHVSCLQRLFWVPSPVQCHLHDGSCVWLGGMIIIEQSMIWCVGDGSIWTATPRL